MIGTPIRKLDEIIPSLSNISLPDDKWGPLLKDIGVKTANAPVTELEAALNFAGDKDALINGIMAPAFTNPTVMVQNPYFDDYETINELPFVCLANGTQATNVKTSMDDLGATVIYQLQTTDYPCPFRMMGILASYSWVSGQGSATLKPSFSLIPDHIFWKHVSKFTIEINQIEVFSVAAPEVGINGILAHAWIGDVMDPLQFNNGMTNVRKSYINEGPLNTFSKHLRPFGSFYPDHDEGATQKIQYVFMEFPFSFFKTQAMLPPQSTMRIKIVMNQTAPVYVADYFYSFTAMPTTLAANVITFDNKPIGKYQYFQNLSINGIFARQIVLRESIREILYRPVDENIISHENLCNLWRVHLIPRGNFPIAQYFDQQWPMYSWSTFLSSGKSKCSLRYVTAVQIALYDIVPPGAFFQSLMIPGGIFNYKTLLNGKEITTLPSIQHMFDNYPTSPNSTYIMYSNYVDALHMVRKSQWENTNGTLNSRSPYEVALERRLTNEYFSGIDFNLMPLKLLNELCCVPPDLLNLTNEQWNFNGLGTPQEGTLEMKFLIAPLEQTPINFQNQYLQPDGLGINVKGIYIFEELPTVISYGPKNPTKSQNLLETLTAALPTRLP